jgi:hypothetical protein
VRNARRKVLLLHDLDAGEEVEGTSGLRRVVLFLEGLNLAKA